MRYSGVDPILRGQVRPGVYINEALWTGLFQCELVGDVVHIRLKSKSPIFKPSISPALLPVMPNTANIIILSEDRR